MKDKERLDVLLTEGGYAETRSKAQALIMAGLVYVDGQKADKPGVAYERSRTIEVRGAACPYVSRGGLKLEKALREVFDFRPAGIIKMLDLRRPIYKQTAAYGHFGRNDLDLPWERTDKVKELQEKTK